jgi:WD40 repeat protein
MISSPHRIGGRTVGAARLACASLATMCLLAGQVGTAVAAGGQQLWASILTKDNAGVALAVSPDGTRVFIAGTIGLGGAADYLTVAYRAGTGKVIWRAQYAGSTTWGDTPSSIAVSPDGTRVYVTGVSQTSSTNYGDYATVAYDAATGAQLWVARYDASSNDFPCCVKVSPDGTRVIVTGSVLTARQGSDDATVAYDTTSGAQLWVATYNAARGGDDVPHDLGISPDGFRVFVTGQSLGADNYDDYATIAYDLSTGAQEWVARFNDHDKPGDIAYALAVSPDGATVFVTGCAGTIDQCVVADYVTIAYDAANGVRRWGRSYDGPISGYDVATSIDVSPDGSRVYVTGSSDQVATTDFVTIAYDTANGAQDWLAVYAGPSDARDFPCCVRASPDGTKVVVTGLSLAAATESISTVAYSSTDGSQLWSAQFGASPFGYTRGLGLTPNGSLAFVTGTFCTCADYEAVTLAYTT